MTNPSSSSVAPTFFGTSDIGIRIPRNKSIACRNVFVHESGIHTAGVIRNPFTYEPHTPEIIGAERQLLIGNSSGREVIRHKVEKALCEPMQLKASIEKGNPRITGIQKEIQRTYDAEEPGFHASRMRN